MPVTRTVETLADGWAGTYQTLPKAAKFVRDARLDPQVRQQAAKICSDAGVRGHDFKGEVKALFEYCRDKITYRRDPWNVELLQDVKRSQLYGIGDCDDKVIALCSYLAALGHCPAFVVHRESEDPQSTQSPGHIFCEVLNDDGSWTPLDPTLEGASVGWEAPFGQTWSYQIFDPGTEGMGSMNYAVERNFLGYNYGVARNLRGFGDLGDPTDVSSSLDPIDVSPDPNLSTTLTAPSSTVPSGFPLPSSVPQQSTVPTGFPLPTTSPTQPSIGTDLSSILNTGINDASKVLTSIFGNPQTVAAQNSPIIAPGVIRPVGASVGVTASPAGVGVSVSSGMILLAIAGVALFMIGKGKR